MSGATAGAIAALRGAHRLPLPQPPLACSLAAARFLSSAPQRPPRRSPPASSSCASLRALLLPLLRRSCVSRRRGLGLGLGGGAGEAGAVGAHLPRHGHQRGHPARQLPHPPLQDMPRLHKGARAGEPEQEAQHLHPPAPRHAVRHLQHPR